MKSQIAIHRSSIFQAVPAAAVRSDTSSRMIGPDILRFVAVSLVLCRHGLILGSRSPSWGQTIQRAFHNGGWVGVDIFFVLSGFLVSGLLFQEYRRRNTVSVGRFLLRRGFKIYPSFWFFLIVATLLTTWGGWPANGQQPLTVRRFLCEFFFLQNFIDTLYFHTWSLAVEEHFYLLLAGATWLVFRLRRDPKNNPFASMPKWFVCAAAVCLALRIINNRIFPPSYTNETYSATYLRLDSLFFGVLLSYLWHFKFTPAHHRFLQRWRFALVAIGIGLLVPMFFDDPFQRTWIRVYGFILCYLGAGALLMGSIKIFADSRSRPVRFVAYLGANSYPVYLWHWQAITLGSSLIPAAAQTPILSAPLWIFLLTQVIAWSLGIAAARLVEAPTLRLRDRLFPSLSGRPQPAAQATVAA